MENAKTLILNDRKNPEFKAILNLKNYDSCVIKFFNFFGANKNYALGIKQKHSVIKIPLDLKQGKGEFVLPKTINLEENLLCAVVDVSNVFCPEIVLSGSLNDIVENNKIEQAFVQTKPEDVSSLYVEDEEEQIERIIDKNLEEDSNTTYYDLCSNCKYRKVFYESGDCVCCSSKSETKNEVDDSVLNNNLKGFNVDNEKNKVRLEEDEEINDKLELIDEEKFKESFYKQIKNQIDTLFNRYERDSLLEKIIPNSRWVKVDYDKNQEYYVLGLIYEDEEEPVYISYGIPSNNSNNPPEDLKEFAQWLPIDFNNPDKEGYWIVYQDAVDGKTLKIDFD